MRQLRPQRAPEDRRASHGRARRRLRAATFCAALASACAPADRAGPGAQPEVIVWVEVDTLRADALGVYGFDELGEHAAPATPALDAFAAESVLFERSFATAPWTIPALTSQLSGRWPFEHGANALLRPLPQGLELLPERLAAEGWATAGVTTNFVTRGELGFARGFDAFDDSLATGHEGATGAAAVQRLLELERELPEGRDRFLFALLFEPHFRYLAQPGRRFGPGYGSRADAPYSGPLTGAEELPALRERLAKGAHTAEDAEFLRGLYQSDVAELDRAFGELRAGLEARDLWDRAWVVFTSDHGEEFGEHGWIGHTTSLRTGMLHVPLIVKPPAGLAPERAGARVAEPVSQLDLHATLLAMAGLEPGAGAVSASLLPAVLGEAPPARRFLLAYTRFEPLLRSASASAKHSHLWGVIDAEAGLQYTVDRLAGDALPAFAPRLEGLDGELIWDGTAEPDAALRQRLAPLLRRRGLLPEPLAPGAIEAERLLPPEDFERGER